ncbi:YggS family pyridoxal phosphate-dependent enzyme [Aequorivita sp. SDUM287046]|uniref:Pyridoxal phosphate homeostasis protein n=1 Tax=Aequorivita aurantiaca TaxID=3053356 RepID=A0ABT8DEX4_9FLAO|nr:YggS family pyridoxal phosphate-dependent enzyme [Aequorivita aurantiaca]MDN3723871.1 YggS family pyridoxal phosphate-dependent enzyme [Aequorivita aurantiaca]
MMIAENIQRFKNKLPKHVTLVAVSKTKPVDELMQAYNAGQRIFGENKIQEMEAKWQQMPKDIQWHMIGHVQRNKVKFMAPFVSLIHAVDSFKLLKEIDKEAKKNARTIECLLQIKIAEEESKFGMEKMEAYNLLISEEVKKLTNVKIVGLMGMASFTENEEQLSEEFQKLKKIFEEFRNHPIINGESNLFKILSMGMSGDYEIAIKNGSNMVRVGSAIFGERNYQ